MQMLRIMLVAAVAVSLGTASPARAQEGTTHAFEASVLGGVQALNRNDTALPDHFVNIPTAATLGYHLNPTWALEGEFSWVIPVKRTVDLGNGVSADRKTPNHLSYQANVVANLPVTAAMWSPYVTAGAGAMTFLSSTDADRYPQLTKSETAFAINFGAGTRYQLVQNVALRVDFREFAAFPSKDATGLSSDGKADPIWMERGTLGLSYQF